MTLQSDNQNNIKMYKGDTGNLIFRNLPKDKNYTGHFSINNDETGKIIAEKQATIYNQSLGTARVEIDKVFSDMLPVGEWTFSFKLCYSVDGSENTVLPALDVIDGEIVQQTPPSFIVLDKRTEGTL